MKVPAIFRSTVENPSMQRANVNYMQIFYCMGGGLPPMPALYNAQH